MLELALPGTGFTTSHGRSSLYEILSGYRRDFDNCSHLNYSAKGSKSSEMAY